MWVDLKELKPQEEKTEAEREELVVAWATLALAAYWDNSKNN
jgi:hypothetical protein